MQHEIVVDEKGRKWYKPLPAPMIPQWSMVACDVRDENKLTTKQFHDMIWYLGLCENKGFAKTDDQIRLCAMRWIAGKRKVTPPGTEKKKREARRARKILQNVPKELLAAIDEASALPMAKQYLEGNEKVFNALFGFVMKKFKAEPQVVRELLTKKLEGMKHG